MSTPELASLPSARTIAEAIAAALRSDITSGRLGAGERLRQVELAQRFAVSTTPVREALAILQQDSLVRLHPQRGASVFVPSVEELEEHYEIRAALEALAVEKAAANFAPSDAPRLQALLAELRSTTEPDVRVALNHEFHMGLYAIARMERLRALINGLRQASAAYVHIAAAEGLPPEQSNHEHEQILRACEAGDAEAAASAMRHHLAQTRIHVTDKLAIKRIAAGID